MEKRLVHSKNMESAECEILAWRKKFFMENLVRIGEKNKGYMESVLKMIPPEALIAQLGEYLEDFDTILNDAIKFYKGLEDKKQLTSNDNT